MSCSKKKPGLSTAVILQMLILLILLTPILGQEKQDTAQQLHQIFDDYWQFLLKENPLMATARGDLRYNDRLSDESVAAYERRNQARLNFLTRIEEIARDPLSEEDQLNYDLFKGQLQWNIQEFKFKTYLQPVHQRSGFHLSLPDMHERIPFQTKKHYEDYLARLKAIPGFISQIMERLKDGARQGRTPPKHVLQSVPEQIRILTSKPVERFPLFEPFHSFPDHLSGQEQEKLRDRGKHVLQTDVIQAFMRFKEFYEQDYIPKATEEISASERYPDGEAFYAYRIRRFTTTDMAAQDIHDLGLKEVSRIKNRMQEIIDESGFEGSFQEFIELLRTDEQFYYMDPEDLLMGYRDICKRMDAALPKLFGKLPRAPYGVRAVPEYAAPQATTAYYSRPSPDGKRPGWFYANTYDLKSRPKYEMEALSLHEAVPGHHLQIALQQELENVP
ncbi:DUF885 domain-containing protein, partial [candidate division KSB1 bacterium]|nr:DUF885 domain-containing protein [candidate division KSB1 bacterium]NIR70296.1 DUF885 domain-containing protein [candidate division KSB1 bacterium]NIS24457.1 DUF885 domain-containing protein [candidate division KSB1 bacterium]NIT71392.1 DUF885 domain-containing protein [candidate division KSB1 bacterium]NIU25077.1 DUF885 domain-containing protein [candidate division KSB1 bacterium]